MIENNKLIAEFLGWEQFGSIGLYDTTFHNNKGSLHWLTKNMRFHNDWNWLMEVVNKIEKTNLGSLEIQSKNLVLLQYNQKTDKYYNSTLIENVYNACVQFIKWYNENLTNQTKNETSCK